MLYILAIIFPPLGVLLTGRVGGALLNLVLTICLYFPGLIHALLVVQDHKNGQRHNQMIRAIGGRNVRPGW